MVGFVRFSFLDPPEQVVFAELVTALLLTEDNVCIDNSLTALKLHVKSNPEVFVPCFEVLSKIDQKKTQSVKYLELIVACTSVSENLLNWIKIPDLTKIIPEKNSSQVFFYQLINSLITARPYMLVNREFIHYYLYKWSEITMNEERSAYLELLSIMFQKQPLLPILILDFNLMRPFFGILNDFEMILKISESEIPIEIFLFVLKIFANFFLQNKNKSYFCHELAKEISPAFFGSMKILVEFAFSKIDSIIFFEKFFDLRDRQDKDFHILMEEWIKQIRPISFLQPSIIFIVQAVSLSNFLQRAKSASQSGKSITFSPIMISKVIFKLFSENVPQVATGKIVLPIHSSYQSFVEQIKIHVFDAGSLLFFYKTSDGEIITIESQDSYVKAIKDSLALYDGSESEMEITLIIESRLEEIYQCVMCGTVKTYHDKIDQETFHNLCIKCFNS